MIVDASALLAAILNKADSDRHNTAMAEACVAGRMLMPGSAWLEACMVVDRRSSPTLTAKLEAMVDKLPIAIVALQPGHFRLARDAWARYGKQKHPAGLNFGSCMVYVFAKAMAELLLFKDRDLSQTDIEPALKD